MRKFLSLIASLALVGGLFVATTGAALADSPDAYHKNCGYYGDGGDHPVLAFTKHHDDLGGYMEGVRGTIHVGDNTTGYTCVPNGGADGNTYIWAANMQNDGAGIIQWGICRIGSTGTWKMCYNIFDGLGGAGIQYVNQPLNGTPPPIVAGHDYYFQITGCSDNGVAQWCLYVDDLDALSGDPTFRVGRSWDYNTGFLSWWGVETQDPGGVMGYRSGADTKTYIYDMMYKRHSDNVWVYRQQSACDKIYWTQAGIRGTYFKCSTDDTRYTNDTLRAYTLAQ